MYIIKNAYKSIVRAKGRNILIFILVFLIAVSACVALSVRDSAEAAKETAYNSLSITAQISANRQGIMGSFGSGERPQEGEFDPESMMGGGMMDGRNSADLTVIGYSSHDTMTTFISGENVICEGNVFQQDSSDGNLPCDTACRCDWNRHRCGCITACGRLSSAEQVASVETTSTTMNENFGGSFQGGSFLGGGNRFQNIGNLSGNEVAYLDYLNTTTDVSVLLSLMAISILLTLIASSVGMISVLRYEPLKILSER